MPRTGLSTHLRRTSLSRLPALLLGLLHALHELSRQACSRWIARWHSSTSPAWHAKHARACEGIAAGWCPLWRVRYLHEEQHLSGEACQDDAADETS